MELDLALIWAGIISYAVLTYVILDGFDLGIGILFPFAAQYRTLVCRRWCCADSCLPHSVGALIVKPPAFGPQ